MAVQDLRVRGLIPMNSQDAFLQIVRLGIGHSADRITDEIDWNDIQDFAEQQGLYAIVLDGVEKLPVSLHPPQDLLLEWIGEVLQDYEQRFKQYKRAIAELASFYNSHGYKMMVLKGYACGLNWPKPEHRPYGDIDIWQFGQQKEADALLESLEFGDESLESVDSSKSSKCLDKLGGKAEGKSSKIVIDTSHHHHTVFEWQGFTVENHYDFVNVYHRKSNRELEAIFKELGADDSHFVEVKGEKVFLPSPNLHVLFLLKHTMNDFTSFSMNLRQLLDWAFFVEKHSKEIEWKWLVGVLEKYHMLDFFNTINAICVEELGFDASIFFSHQIMQGLKDKVLKDILEPKFTAEESTSLIPRLIYKYRRWRGNAWKHELCYQESMWSTFWYGVWGHLLKPKSI